jgi:hypothetical protein
MGTAMMMRCKVVILLACRGVAVQVGIREKAKAWKPGFHITGSGVETGRFQAMGHNWIRSVQRLGFRV